MAPRPPNPNHPLVKARERVGYQQKVAADRLGISPNTLGRYERGERRPDSALLERMAQVYRVPIETLLAPASVSRGTHPVGTRVAEKSAVYGADIGPGDERGGLWVIEQMSLALADIARRLREATARK